MFQKNLICLARQPNRPFGNIFFPVKCGKVTAYNVNMVLKKYAVRLRNTFLRIEKEQPRRTAYMCI